MSSKVLICQLAEIETFFGYDLNSAGILKKNPLKLPFYANWILVNVHILTCIANILNPFCGLSIIPMKKLLFVTIGGWEKKIK